MASRVRRALPDNLDPLVDTLANVVGILVIVIVLTQIELGDALDRLVDVEDRRIEAELAHAADIPLVEASLESRHAALKARTERGVESSISLARRVLEDLSGLPKRQKQAETEAAQQRLEISAARETLAAASKRVEERARYEVDLRNVPAQLVARLPDPEVVRGLESWILVRYGRVYPIDREVLFDQGSAAIRRILPDGGDRRVRNDEFESVARYLRKKSIGFANFRWQLKNDRPVRVELEWASKDGGIDRLQLSQNAEWQAWLGARTPEKHFIRIHVWNDSFETYLAARQAVEVAGFRAGWKGYEDSEQMKLSLRFGTPLPREREIEVD